TGEAEVGQQGGTLPGPGPDLLAGVFETNVTKQGRAQTRGHARTGASLFTQRPSRPTDRSGSSSRRFTTTMLRPGRTARRETGAQAPRPSELGAALTCCSSAPLWSLPQPPAITC